ncbi:MAG: hypothetical protein PGN13_12300 [Patulibacter minatonensis]
MKRSAKAGPELGESTHAQAVPFDPALHSSAGAPTVQPAKAKKVKAPKAQKPAKAPKAAKPEGQASKMDEFLALPSWMKRK